MTQLPANLRLLPGVRSDHKGRKYQFAEYPSGKRIAVPYQDHADIPPARMIPAPADRASPAQRKPLTTDSGDGKPKPVICPRLAILEYRWQGDLRKREFEQGFLGTFPEFEDWLLMHIKPLMRSPDCGTTWVPVEPVLCDYHVCHHKDK